MGTRDKLARLAKRKTKVKAKPISPVRTHERTTPQRLFCGHWDFDFNRETGECRACIRGSTTTYPSAVADGFVSAMVHHMERLSVEFALLMSESADTEVQASRAVVASRIRRMQEATARAAGKTGAMEVFERYPNLGAMVDALYEPKEAASLAEKGEAEPGSPEQGGGVPDAALDPVT